MPPNTPKWTTLCQIFGRSPNKHCKKVCSCACQLSPEVTSYHSGSLSHHWGHCWVLLALLPAWAGAPIIIHQDITAYAVLPLWSAHLVRASHQRGQKDMMRAHTLHRPASTRMTGRRDPSQLNGFCNCATPANVAFCASAMRITRFRKCLGEVRGNAPLPKKIHTQQIEPLSKCSAKEVWRNVPTKRKS